jgi:hypothetical protein
MHIKMLKKEKGRIFFSRKFLSYRLGSIIEENEHSDIMKDVKIAQNIINICDEIDGISKFSLEYKESKPTLVVYTQKKIHGKDQQWTVSFEFVKENDLWVISSISECCVSLKDGIKGSDTNGTKLSLIWGL